MIQESYKDKTGKVSLLEVSPNFLKGMAERLNSNKISHGGKYEPFNWKNSDPIEIFEAFQRHTLDIHSWIVNNKPILSNETLKEHILAATVNLMFMYEYELEQEQNDSKNDLPE